MGKRQILARAAHTFGITRLLESCREKPGILVINYHRIGKPQDSRFDRGIFSGTAEDLDSQVRYLKRRHLVIGGEELESLCLSGKPLKRLYVVLTFDDGYLDNFTTGFQVLRSHDCAGLFFLVSGFVGTNVIPWWDAIAYLVRSAKPDRLRIAGPEPATVLLEGDRERAIRAIMRKFKELESHECDAFLEDLKAQSGCELPGTERRFLDWAEAREMQAAGMTIGSHTCTHRILSRLTEEEQRLELTESRRIIESQLGRKVAAVAYPIGLTSTFTGTTTNLAAEAGYTLGFSFYGGMNRADALNPIGLLRTALDPDPLVFRNQIAFYSRLGELPYLG